MNTPEKPSEQYRMSGEGFGVYDGDHKQLPRINTCEMPEMYPCVSPFRGTQRILAVKPLIIALYIRITLVLVGLPQIATTNKKYNKYK